jgi:photosystem II stability/assembly factor-like uncharacterized protein
MKRLFHLIFVFVAAVAPLSMSVAQSIDAKLFQEMHWRNIGPFRGGRALAVTGVRGNRDIYYFGSVDGGVWKTSNAGVTWKPIFDAQPVASIGAVAVAPSNSNVIYVGTGEADMRSNISLGQGLYKSEDAGEHWQFMGLRDTRQIARIVVDPNDPNIVLVAALGHAYGPTPERGVFRSADGGKTWQKVLFKDENTGAIDLALDPTNSKIVYAALWQARRPPWSVYPPIEGPGGGIYKSTDGGLTWNELNGNGLPPHPWQRIGLAVSRQDDGKHVYALVQCKEGGLYRSDDSGTSWRRAGEDYRIREREWYFSEITVDPKDPETIYFPNVAIMRSTDGGKTVEAIKGAPGGDDYHALWIDPDDPNRMIQGSDQGVSISVDRGATWSSWYNQPTAQFYHVITDNDFPYNVYGAQQDSGTIVTKSRSDYGSISFRDWDQTGGGEAGYIAPDPTDRNTVYAGDTYGSLQRFDKRTGQAQEISPSAGSSFGTPISQRDLRFTWTSPVIFSPQDPHTLYMGAQEVLATNDRGMSWHAISPDLTGCDPAQKSAPGEPTIANSVKRCYGVIYTIAPSPVAAGTIWVGSDTGLIHLTRDGGQTWADVTPSGLGDWSKMSIIDASPHHAGTAYVAVDRHRLDDVEPYFYRTHDYGKTWQKITNGISAPAYANVVREDPVRKGLLFAGTETGIYVSFDDGDHWQPLQLNLPVTAVRDLVIHENDLVIATHGRSFWILDDITPLRQASAEIAQQSAFLFTPQKALRVRRDTNNETPLPPETPQGENPPAGAIIDYFLKDASTAPVKLEIYDQGGNLVRSYASDEPPAPPPSLYPGMKPPIAPYWLPPEPRLSGAAGMHRWLWDLRLPSPPSMYHEYTIAAVPGTPTPAEPEGVLAIPGNYEVRLTVDGKTLTQPLVLGPDPRVSATQADYEKQFKMASALSADMRQSFTAIQQIESLKSQLKALQPKVSRDRKLAGAAAALEANASQIEGRGQPPTTEVVHQAGLAKLNGTFASLLGAVESADAAPTTQVQQKFAEDAPALASLLRQWQQLQQRDLAAFNAELRSHKLTPIDLSSGR